MTCSTCFIFMFSIAYISVFSNIIIITIFIHRALFKTHKVLHKGSKPLAVYVVAQPTWQ